MKYYKLTTQDNTTTNHTIWGRGVTHKATGQGTALCSCDVIHVYKHPLLAILFNPIHAGIPNPKLWVCKTSKPINTDGLKIGVKCCTTMYEEVLPIITTEQRVKFAILVAKKVCKSKNWNVWADKWLSGKDRTSNAAYNAAYAAYDAHAASAASAAHAAYDAAYDAAHAAHDAHAAYNAAYAAYDAVTNIGNLTPITFLVIIKKIMTE
jgi:hypothetical protein